MMTWGKLLSQARINSSTSGTLDEIINFTGRSSGLRVKLNHFKLHLYQLVDKKELVLNSNEIAEVIHRVDSENVPFLQLNFVDGRKILLTDQLIGFKPFEVTDLDMKKIPKVVTTPDLFNVIDALDDSLDNPLAKKETTTLKRIYVAILKGADNIGFNVDQEKELYHNLIVKKLKGTA